MSESSTHSAERKPCRFCEEPLKVTARNCPHCGLTQKVLALRLSEIVTIFTIAFVFGTIWLCVHLVAGGRDFAKDRGKLVVLHSTLTVNDPKERVATLTGIVTNQSSHAWSHLEFDVRFYSTNGVMIDAIESAADDFTIASHDEHSFKLVLYRYRMKDSYASHELLVRGASQPNSW